MAIDTGQLKDVKRSVAEIIQPLIDIYIDDPDNLDLLLGNPDSFTHTKNIIRGFSKESGRRYLRHYPRHFMIGYKDRLYMFRWKTKNIIDYIACGKHVDSDKLYVSYHRDDLKPAIYKPDLGYAWAKDGVIFDTEKIIDWFDRNNIDYMNATEEDHALFKLTW